jgi:hypothetical protein
MPDTLPDLMLGLAVVFGVLGLFLASVYIRQLNALKTIRLIKQLEDET